MGMRNVLHALVMLPEQTHWIHGHFNRLVLHGYGTQLSLPPQNSELQSKTSSMTFLAICVSYIPVQHKKLSEILMNPVIRN